MDSSGALSISPTSLPSAGGAVHPRPARRSSVHLLALAFAAAAPCLAAAEPVSFSRKILPILSDACFACHGPDEKARKGGLRLDTEPGAHGAGDSGERAIVPRDSASSEVMRRLLSTDPDEAMPPPTSNHKITPDQIALVRRWIDEGATWGKHWAFEPPQRPAVPAPSPGELNPIDTLVRTRLANEGLTPSPEAKHATLLRRVTLDLTGVPPTPEETAAFVVDPAPDAYERAVDRLLASPRYGERMSWEWLEAARYADSNGYQGDSERTMWPWRDWVVDAFNRNLPYDQFSVWQIAGDLLPAATHEQKLATGFLRNHMINGEGGRIPEENRIDYLFDQTETVATVWLGATFNCNRCHDHKYDPYSQRDYFSLLAFFNQTRVDGSGGNPQSPPVLDAPSPEVAQKLAEWQPKLEAATAATARAEDAKFARDPGQPLEQAPAAKDLPREILDHLNVAPAERDAGRLEKLAGHWKDSDPEYARVLADHRQARQERDAFAAAVPKVMVMEDMEKPRQTFVLSRGDYLKPTTEVGMALPEQLAGGRAPSKPNRLGLAEWLVSPDHPLTARVTVNRFWQSLFGIGLVKTAEDFGLQGERPVQPELLDWLAVEFVQSGWNVKHLLRLIVTSATYRQASQVTPAAAERDPENRLLARGPRFRIPSWMIRDTALAASGLLVETRGGPSIKPYQPLGVWEEATFGNKRYEQDHGDALYRRSLYVFWRRIVGPTLFFDVASRQTCTVKTPRTNVPLHALLTLNDTTYLEAARALAQRVLVSEPDTPARLGHAFRRVLGREPSAEEQAVLTRALDRHRATYAADPAAAAALLATGESPRDATLDPAEHAAWTLVCTTILNLDEALTKE
jgi:hypothetical protein